MKLRHCFSVNAALALPLTAATTPGIISTFAGGGPKNVSALSAAIPGPGTISIDNSGNFYVTTSSSGGMRVYKVSAAGTLTLLAGSGAPGYSGDGGPATQAELDVPDALAVDSSGDLYIADTFNCVIRKVAESTGLISTIAGTPQSCAYSGDGGSATSAELNYPHGIALDTHGNIYIADSANSRVRKMIASTGVISTIAGDGSAGYLGDGGPAISAELNYPSSVAVDGSGNIYIADDFNYRIRTVTAGAGTIKTIAGNGKAGFSGDGGPATSAEINLIAQIASDAAGNVFIADDSNCAIREVNIKGVINTVAGEGTKCGYSGDGGKATGARLQYPEGVMVNNSDTVYIADSGNYVVRKAALAGDIATIAGNGTVAYTSTDVATNASFYFPGAAIPDASGSTYITDSHNGIVRRVDSSGAITTIAGTPPPPSRPSGECGYSGDGGPATSALLCDPEKTVADSAGNIYIADTYNCAIRKIDGNGVISTFAGGNRCGYSGDGGAATSAQLYYPYGLTLDSIGNVYIADMENDVIRKIEAATGIISTVAGNHSAGFSGDGGSAIDAQLNGPHDIAVDALGNLYIADYSNNRVRIVSSGIIRTFAGNGTPGYGGDGKPATAASLQYPQSLAVDVAGDVLIADTDNQRVRWVNGAGIIYTLAGTGTWGSSGDGGVATSAGLFYPQGVGVDPSGNTYIADTENGRVREVTAVPNLNSSAYSLTFPAQKAGTSSQSKGFLLKVVGALTIESLKITGDFTQQNRCPSELSSGSSCEVNVTFKPSSTGTKTGAVTITTNGFFSPTVTISLSGTGD